MPPDIIRKIHLKGGENSCHRKQPVVITEGVAEVEIIHHPCLREKCTLWDHELDQCRDVSNAAWLVEIAKSLDNLVKQADVLCFHAGEK